MPATIQFVDSLASSPTVRLDINDAATWFCQDFQAPPPRLRRSESNNAMRDGGVVGSSNYDNRTLTLQLTIVNTATEDVAATEMQKLWRELDRPTNWIRYQREGMTKPVFFRTFRSDTSDLEELWTTPIARNITVEILAEPFALGLKETLGPFTVNNDVAAASNGCYFDVTGVVGDVPAPMVLWHNNVDQTTRDLIAVTPTSAPLTTWQQAESGSDISFGTDTSNPGTATDAQMSGSGTANYARTTFSTNSTMVTRVFWNVPAITPPGNYRVLAFVRQPNNSAFRTVQLWAPNSSATLVAQSPIIQVGSSPFSSSRRVLVDFGVVAIGSTLSSTAGYSSTSMSGSNFQLQFRAASTSVQPFDWDAFMLVPAGDQTTTAIVSYLSTSTNNGLVLDGIQERAIFQTLAGDPTTGSGVANFSLSPSLSGGFPSVTPNVTNRVTMIRCIVPISPDTIVDSFKAHSCSVSVAYWPRYLTVRPVSS